MKKWLFLQKDFLVRWSLLFCLLLSGCATLGTFNPATGQREFIFITTSMEVNMGANMHRQILQKYRVSRDQEKIRRLNSIGQKIAAVSDRQDYSYHFFLLKNKELNAFTAPGGNIYIFEGLFDKLSSDDEVAGVLAHEIGHCAARHVVKKLQAAMGYNLVQSLALSRWGGGREQTVQQIAGLAVNLVFSAYSRRDEYEADRLAVKYLYLAGYDLNGMIKSLRILMRESHGATIPLWLRTHPFIEDRLKTLKEEIKKAASEYSRS